MTSKDGCKYKDGGGSHIPGSAGDRHQKPKGGWTASCSLLKRGKQQACLSWSGGGSRQRTSAEDGKEAAGQVYLFLHNITQNTGATLHDLETHS